MDKTNHFTPCACVRVCGVFPYIVLEVNICPMIYQYPCCFNMSTSTSTNQSCVSILILYELGMSHTMIDKLNNHSICFIVIIYTPPLGMESRHNLCHQARKFIMDLALLYLHHSAYSRWLLSSITPLLHQYYPYD